MTKGVLVMTPSETSKHAMCLHRDWLIRGKEIPRQMTFEEAEQKAEQMHRDSILKSLTTNVGPPGTRPAFKICFGTLHSIRTELTGWGSRTSCRLQKPDWTPITLEDLRTRGWTFTEEHCILFSCINPENAILMEAALHRLVFSYNLEWEQCLNSKIGGVGKEYACDGTPCYLVVCYRLGGIGDLVVKMDKRFPGEHDLALTIACLLKSPIDVFRRALVRLNPSEREIVRDVIRVALEEARTAENEPISARSSQCDISAYPDSQS